MKLIFLSIFVSLIPFFIWIVFIEYLHLFFYIISILFIFSL